uniref:Cytochrome c biogenesis protein n=1 Tax=Hypnea pseudomusciformis TaxID=1545697 RepID=UPI0027DA5BF5|nr:Cytochrome c biogenesis protein [Hypnea pseudomusciformis]WCH55038.1 Cytochrome c biogenesis protein [Hypnea pseudomusciformis]WCH56631.1 Cytochrome c biogenesis protein [Hypnea pseudomusciformis]
MKYLQYKTLKWKIIKQLSNLNFSIGMLLIISSTSILGTIIEQDKNIEYYQSNYPIQSNIIYFFNWKNIIYFGLNHVYTTWWFILLIALFFCSLITCTFSQQLPSLRNARHWKFPHYHKNKNSNIDYLPIKSFINIIYSLNQHNYYVFQRNNKIYGYKGLVGRLAPIFVHISIIITLTGNMLGLFTGFISQEIIPKGEIFHIQNFIKSGKYSYLPYNIIGKIDNFSIEYNPNSSIKQFYSSISLKNNKNENLIQQRIYVNSPLKFHGLIFYQTSWNLEGLKIQIDNKLIQQKLQEIKINKIRAWIYNFNFTNHKSLFFLINGLNNQISIYNSSGQLLKNIKTNETFNINKHQIIIKEIIPSTGIQIKTDPGIPIVYLGFFILIISIITSYLSYNQIWINSQNNRINLKGTTNRGQLTFEEELTKIQKYYIEITI